MVWIPIGTAGSLAAGARTLAALGALGSAMLAGCAGAPTPALDPAAPTALSPIVPTPVEAPAPTPSSSGGGTESAPLRNPSQPGPVRVEAWFNGNRPGERIVSDHYSIRTTLRNGDLRKFIPTFMEKAMSHYRSALCELPQVDRELETFIFGNRDEWVAFTQARLGAEADAYLGLGRGGYTSKATAILYDIGPTDTLTILAHEGWHQFSQALLREELPVWLEEGIATYMEGYRINPATGEPVFSAWRNFERFGELREAVRRDALIPLESLLEHPPQYFLTQGRDRLLVYYAQVWALTHFLHEGDGGRYRAGLSRLLADAVAGRVGETLVSAAPSGDRRSVERAISRGSIRSVPGACIVRTYLGADPAALAAGYDAFVRQVVARGSGDAIWRGASPIKPSSQ